MCALAAKKGAVHSYVWLLIRSSSSCCPEDVLPAGWHIIAGQMWEPLQNMEQLFSARQTSNDLWE